jgi:hypothetical protein
MWHICIGMLILVSGLIPFGLTASSDLPVPARIIAFEIGLILYMIGANLLLTAPLDDELNFQISGARLGRVKLNGRWLVAYEQEDPCGRRRFRLAASTWLSSEKEAALVRYLVLEEFIVSLWADKSTRIQQEASWAFLI